jgi:hypothetical protein
MCAGGRWKRRRKVFPGLFRTWGRFEETQAGVFDGFEAEAGVEGGSAAILRGDFEFDGHGRAGPESIGGGEGGEEGASMSLIAAGWANVEFIDYNDFASEFIGPKGN